LKTNFAGIVTATMVWNYLKSFVSRLDFRQILVKIAAKVPAETFFSLRFLSAGSFISGFQVQYRRRHFLSYSFQAEFLSRDDSIPHRINNLRVNTGRLGPIRNSRIIISLAEIYIAEPLIN